MKKALNPSKKKPLNERLEEAGASSKKVWLILGSLDLAFVLFALYLYYKTKNVIPSFVITAVALFLDYFYLSYVLNGGKRKTKNLESEFVQLFDYFGIYVGEGIPVYTALENIRVFASNEMEVKIKDLLEAIDKDKSVAPYVDFARDFPSLTIKEVMVSIYLMAEEGESEPYLRQFRALFDSLATSKRKLDLEAHLEMLSNLSFLPMIGSGITMAMITVSLVVIIGGLLNGL
jgi:hypothetical protein